MVKLVPTILKKPQSQHTPEDGVTNFSTNPQADPPIQIRIAVRNRTGIVMTLTTDTPELAHAIAAAGSPREVGARCLYGEGENLVMFADDNKGLGNEKTFRNVIEALEARQAIGSDLAAQAKAGLSAATKRAEDALDKIQNRTGVVQR